MPNPDRNLRLDYLEFNVAVIAAAKAFYGAAFGWRFTDYGPDYCEFDDGRMKGGFSAHAAPRPAPQQSGRSASTTSAATTASREDSGRSRAGPSSSPRSRSTAGRVPCWSASTTPGTTPPAAGPHVTSRPASTAERPSRPRRS